MTEEPYKILCETCEHRTYETIHSSSTDDRSSYTYKQQHLVWFRDTSGWHCFCGEECLGIFIQEQQFINDESSGEEISVDDNSQSSDE